MKTTTKPGNHFLSTSLRRWAGATALAVPAALVFAFAGTARAETRSASIPFSELGARATTDYQGDALAVTATPEGARLRCGFQKLEGRATAEGLWLESTAPGGGQLRLLATVVERGVLAGGALPTTGAVSVEGKVVAFTRPGVTEEYSVSVDGARQDFVIRERPIGDGDLNLELGLSGARAEVTAYGAKLMLEGSGRTLAYSRLRVADATGRALPARLEVLSADRLAVRVTDANAAYPIRVDPTFSDANWVSLNPGRPGADNDVYALAADGSGNLYVGGGFTFIGTVPANAIAKWDGSAWSAVGSGMGGGDASGPYVLSLVVSGTNLYVGGDFTTAGGVAASYIARWDGSAWSALGLGVSDLVNALAVSGSDLYAGGDFTLAGAGTAFHIAKWDGGAWSALGSGTESSVYALAVSGANLYAGGRFTTAGGETATNIAKWDGSTWSALGSGMDSTVWALAASGTDLYAGGSFTTAGGVTVNHIAKWDGGTWSALGSGMDYTVFALAVSGSDLYAGGDFGTAGDVPANYVAKWDGSAWSASGSGTDNNVWALAVSGTSLYAGGDFQVAGGEIAFYIARWHNSNWSALNLGMDWNVYALALSGTDLYVGGGFTTAGNVTGNAVAKWNGNAWSALGSGMGMSDPYDYPVVYALAASGTNLYAGGYFETAGGVPASNIAQWNGSAWSPVGLGVNNEVMALAVSGTDLYVGGYFTTASGAGGSVTVNHIAKWNSSGWSALGSGTDGLLNALVVSGTNLYAGGEFATASGVTANNIAKWDGNAWSPLGSGVDKTVEALAVSGTNLYAGGWFTTAGGASANCIARWDGHAWSPLGSGMNDWVYGLAVSGNDLYAGGEFTTVGGSPANYIAKWDGAAWSALGSGVNSATTPVVLALAADSAGHLFVGGYFDLAGTNASPFIAQANLLPSTPATLSIRMAGGAVILDCHGAPGSTYAVQRTTHVRFTQNLTTLLITNAPADGQFRCTDTTPPPAAAFYRLILLTSPPAVIQSIHVSGGVVTLDCQAVAGSAYAVQRATDVRFAQNLATLLTTNVPSSGLFRYTDPTPPSAAAFYRLLSR